MAETIKTISDASQFEELFKQYFIGTEVYLKTKSGDIIIQFLGYHDGNVAFRIPRVKNVPDTIVVYTRNKVSIIYLSLKVLENNEDTFIFTPLKFQIITEQRKGERTEFETAENKNIFYISNIISEGILKTSLDGNEKKVNLVRDMITQDMKGKFERLKIVFSNETTIDVRMKHFMKHSAPLYVQDMSNRTPSKEDVDFNYYINEIHARDFKLSGQSEFISEVSVPIIYKNSIPYGYIQVNNTKPMTDGHLAVIKKISLMVNEFFLKEKIFVPIQDKFLVANISNNGLAIVFKDRRQLRYFIQNSYVVIDMMLPDVDNITLGVIVNNTVFNENGIIKIGLEIVNIDEVGKVKFEKFLQRMN